MMFRNLGRRKRKSDGMALKPHGWLALIGLAVVPACSLPLHVHDGAPVANEIPAVVSGGGFPNLRSVDGEPVPANLVAGKPDTVMAAGAHSLVIDYQPCSNANSCALASVTAEVVLAPGREYDIRHQRDGCTPWAALTGFVRKRETPCRNFLWIEERETDATVWGTAPAGREF